jgi:PAS domain S-box-containing protein
MSYSIGITLLSLGIFYGICISVVFYNLFFYWVNKDKANLLFVLYAVSTTLYFISIDGLGMGFLWSGNTLVNENVHEVAALFTVASLLLYVQSFLHLDELFKKLSKGIYIFIGIRIIVYMLEMLNVITNPLISILFDSATFGFAYFLGIKYLKTSFKPALYFLIGFTGLFVGFIMVEIREVFFSQSQALNRTIDISFHFGFIFQLLLQTLALTVRYKVLDLKEDEMNKQSVREKSWNMLMDILDHIPHQIFLKDHKHRLVLLNKRTADMLHLTREDALGKDDFTFFEKDVAEKYFEEEKEMLRSGKSRIDPEFIFYSKDGDNKIFHSMKMPFYISDIGKHGLLGIEIEITESKKLEKQLVEQNHEIEAQKEQISSLFQEVTDSIKTAKMIQEAIMPPEKALAEYFHDYFVYYQPKDIVSGDFYWLKHPYDHDKIMFATVDCTGHGVAGAFISLIANNLLNKIVDSRLFTTPADILNKLNEEVMLAFNQGPDSKGSSHDGMDITLCIYNSVTMELQFAGACSQLCLVRDEDLQLYKTDHFSIGYLNNKKRAFADFKISLKDGDMLYIYSDGFAGQFGGEDGQRKFLYNRLRNMLLRISPLSMIEQKTQLRNALEEWRGPYEQTDDVMVLGFKF